MDERTDVAPERSVEEIRREIEARRDSITDTVDKLGDRIEQSLDWREHVGRHPYVSMGVAAGLGLLIGRMVAGRWLGPRAPRSYAQPHWDPDSGPGQDIF